MERNEAIDVVKRNYPHVTESGSQFETALRILIPELKESEGERIRKELIQYLKDYPNLPNGNYCRDDFFAWLEKQCESSDQIHYWTEEEIEPIISDFLRGAEHYGGMIARLRCLKPKSLEKQGEQKPVDKVEPKFHEGDWVILSLVGEHDKLVQVQTIEYFPSEQPKYITTDGKWFGDGHNARLWTIKDAKPGDVLVSEFGKPFIFKDCSDTKHPNAPVAYCGINYANNFIISVGRWWASGKVYPATKEQRETLLKAMTDAGHTFDFEKKELKKIEQNPAWSEEDKKFVSDTLGNLTELKDRYGEGYGNVGRCIDWLKSLKNRRIRYDIYIKNINRF